MSTFADIKKAAGRKKPFVFKTDDVPAGHFGVTVTIDDQSNVYLLEGEEGDLNATIKGHVRTVPPVDSHSPNSLDVYKGDEVRGGEFLGKGYVSREFYENFRMMLA